MRRILFLTGIVSLSLSLVSVARAHENIADGLKVLKLPAKTKHDRTAIVNLGASIEAVRSDCVYATVSPSVEKRIRKAGLKIEESFSAENAIFDFPADDARFHNYPEMTQALNDLVTRYSDIASKSSIGKTFQGRDIWAVHINTTKTDHQLAADFVSAKPGIVFMGNHHAREHVSAEIPLMLLEHLLKNYGTDPAITTLVDSRDIYIIPMVNPDGVEFDIDTGRYKWQRKNMRPNGTSKPGVDLNRNYGFGWGTGGSSNDPSSDIFMGAAPFSEPETQAIKAFVESKPNLKVLLSFHTFSELILYPWGGKNEPVSNERDHKTYEAMAQKMATWNGYTPEQASELYIASGDTTDWAYGALGIFSFTFELSPKDMWDGGFYPGAQAIDKIFEANIRPALYLIDLANDPYRALSARDEEFSWLR